MASPVESPPALQIIFAKISLNQEVNAATRLAAQHDPATGRGSDDDLHRICWMRAIEPTNRFRKRGYITLAAECEVDTPLWGWFGVDHVVVQASATRRLEPLPPPSTTPSH